MRIALGLVLLASTAAAQSNVSLWTRGKGGAHLRPQTFALERLEPQEVTRLDVQYGVSRSYRAVPIATLLARYAPGNDVDLALLRFANGMLIPLPFRDAGAMQRLRPAVAVAVREGAAWSASFPEVSRTRELVFDARPLRFGRNKLVVAERWHPDLRPGSEAAFSPWTHADSLESIELVSRAAWLAQFDVDPEVSHAGFVVWSQACQFCHGARKVGAELGWDFVEPLPISEYRRKDASLYYHVRYKPADAPTRGLLMPALPFLDENDAHALLIWLRTLTSTPRLVPYAHP